MTKKHFIQLADALRNHIAKSNSDPAILNAVVETLADYCEQQNPNFNRGRWLSYIAGQCGPNGGVVNH